MVANSNKNNEMIKSQTVWLSVLFVAVIGLFLMLLTLAVNDFIFLKDNIINGQLVKTVSGNIKTVKYYHGGRSGEVMKLNVVPSVKKWVLMGKVSEEESTSFVKGNQIEVEVYQWPNNMLRREYNQKHTLQSLGVKINNKVIRTSEYAKSEAINGRYFMIAASLFGLLVGALGLYFMIKSHQK